MEHRKKGRKLKRTASHKKALLSNLAVALIKNKRIKTTIAKAKELRTVIEPLVTKAIKSLAVKDSKPEYSIHLRRLAYNLLRDREAVKILFDEIAEKVKDRKGGYTRILKLGFRYGDGAIESIIEFVDYSIAKEKESQKTKTSKVEGKKSSEAKEDKTKETKTTKKESDRKKVKKEVNKETSKEDKKTKTSAKIKSKQKEKNSNSGAVEE